MEQNSAPAPDTFDPSKLADAWGSAISQTAKEDPNVSQAGKKPRGRPGASQRPEIGGPVLVSNVLTAERIAGMFRPIFRIACDGFKVARVTEEELAEWSRDAAPFFDRYLSSWLKERGEIVVFILASVALVAPRIEQASDNAKRAKASSLKTSASESFT